MSQVLVCNGIYVKGKKMKKNISLLGLLFMTSTMFAMDSSEVELPKSPALEDIDAETDQQTVDRHAREVRAMQEKYETERIRRNPGGGAGVQEAADRSLSLLAKQHQAEKAGKVLRAKIRAKRAADIPDDPDKFRSRVESDADSMSVMQSYSRLGLRPGAKAKDITKALKKKVEAVQKQQDTGKVLEKESLYEQAMLDKAGQKAGADAQADYNMHGQRVDADGNVVETWGEKFNRWMESAKRRFFGSDRATRVAVELAGLNEDTDEDQFEAALNELKYQLKRYPGRVDSIANAYLKHVTQDNYNDDVIEALQEALPDGQKLVREADGKPFEIRQKASYIEHTGEEPDFSV